jgi:hypothetical protein
VFAIRPALLALLVASLTACSGQSDSSSSQGTPPPLASPDAAATDVTVATDAPVPAGASAPPAPAAAASSSVLKPVALTDVAGLPGERAIRDLVELGVIEPSSGQFHPHAPITRAAFVRWLVKANNAEFISDSKMLRAAEPGDDQAFVDVPSSSPDYPYIQGLANAGYVIGVDAKHFAPQRNITREELVAIYMNREDGGPTSVVTSFDNVGIPYSDAAKISKPYWGAFHDAFYGFYKNVPYRIFGESKLVHPQKLATREEAAIAVSVVQNADARSTVQADGGK